MAELRLTKEQQAVVEARDASLLVAAAAGSGKTAVLVRRILEKLLDGQHPQDIDRLLIVTFTNAAAAEMRERIGAALEEQLAAQPENGHLQRQMMLLHGAQITTIHSFCLSVIREHFHLLALDPGFRIGDEAELSLLFSDVLEQVLERFYEERDEEFLALAECYGSARGDRQLCGYVERLYDYAVSNPWPEEWLSHACDGFLAEKDGFASHPLVGFVRQEYRTALSDALRLCDRMIAVTQEADGPYWYRDCFCEDRDMLEGLLAGADQPYDQLFEALSGAVFRRLPSKRLPADEEKKERAKALRAMVKEIVERLRHDFFYAAPEELFSEQAAMYHPVHGLVRLTEAFRLAYQKEKQEKNLLDFSDLEHLALEVLVGRDGTPTAAARALAERFDEIMIDEYQDSNLIQEAILRSVSGEPDGKPNLFMVGDVKQSIYRFRMARPQLFMEKYRTYTADGDHRRIDLHKNFRSRSSVLAAVNVLFSGLMHEASAEVEYDEAAALYCGASYPEETEADCETEVLLVCREADGDARGAAGDAPAPDGMPTRGEAGDAAAFDDAPTRGEAGDASAFDGAPTGDERELSEEERTAVQLEASAAAARIRELVESGFLVQGKEGAHAAGYGDIVVLLRTMSGWSEAFLEVFTEQGVPAYADTSSGYFKAMEVQKTLQFLRILDNPKQDIPFAAVLHSPIVGLSAQELAQIRIACGTVPGQEKTQRYLYDAARQYADVRWPGEAGSDGRSAPGGVGGPETFAPGVSPEEARETACRLRAFFALYDRLRAEAEYCSIHELLLHFYEYSGYYDLVTVMPAGERRRGNLDMLVTKAKQYEKTSYSGLYDFLRYMDRLIRYEVDFGEAKSGESGGMVRIMSIHKSKGLEFPIVLVCGMEKRMNRMDMRSRMIFHPEWGIGADFVDPKLRVRAPTLLKKAMAAKLSKEMVAEELRVLYVAMTRAKEKLVLIGTVKDAPKRLSAWEERGAVCGNDGLPETFLRTAATYYDVLCPLLFGQGTEGGPGWRKASRTVGQTVFCARFLFGTIEGSEMELARGERTAERIGLRRTLDLLSGGEEEDTREERCFDTDENGKKWESQPDKGLSGEIRALLEQWEAYRYPFAAEAALPTKLSVSELKRLRMLEAEELEAASQRGSYVEALPEEEEASYPRFLKEEKELSGSDRGTIYHHVMEVLPMTEGASQEELARALDALVEQGRLTEQERLVVSCRKLSRFFASELGGRVCAAAGRGTLKREQPFVLGVPARELYPSGGSDEPVLVQGIIDAFFEEDGGLVLLDYKTDVLRGEGGEELKRKYRAQISYYKEALERLYGLPVREAWLYSFFADQAVRV